MSTTATIGAMLASLPEADRAEVRERFDQLAWRMRSGPVDLDPCLNPAPTWWWEERPRCHCCGGDVPAEQMRCRWCATALHLALLAREAVPL